jgi:hypothetical protein
MDTILDVTPDPCALADVVGQLITYVIIAMGALSWRDLCEKFF